MLGAAISERPAGDEVRMLLEYAVFQIQIHEAWANELDYIRKEVMKFFYVARKFLSAPVPTEQRIERLNQWLADLSRILGMWSARQWQHYGHPDPGSLDHRAANFCDPRCVIFLRGRELDAAVAQHVLGWKLTETQYEDLLPGPIILTPKGEEPLHWIPERGKTYHVAHFVKRYHCKLGPSHHLARRNGIMWLSLNQPTAKFATTLARSVLAKKIAEKRIQARGGLVQFSDLAGNEL